MYFCGNADKIPNGTMMYDITNTIMYSIIEMYLPTFYENYVLAQNYRASTSFI